jgi:ubiquinone/menaquinone biosynthesis C-methylase UbiE
VGLNNGGQSSAGGIGKVSQGQEQRVQEHFDRVSGRYASWYTGETSNAHSFSTRLSRVLEMLPDETGSLLDVGCGPGLLFQSMREGRFAGANGATRWIGMDFAAQMLMQAKTRVDDGKKPQALLVRGDVTRIPFPDCSIDTVTNMGLMEYLDDEDTTLQEIARVLKPGGAVIITLPNVSSPFRIWHRFMRRVFSFLRKVFSNHRRVGYLDSFLGPFGQDSLGHREYSQREYRERLRSLGLKTVDVCGYNFKIALTPLDKWLPRVSIAVARKLEVLARTPLRFMGTSFIIKAEKI